MQGVLKDRQSGIVAQAILKDAKVLPLEFRFVGSSTSRLLETYLVKFQDAISEQDFLALSLIFTLVASSGDSKHTHKTSPLTKLSMGKRNHDTVGVTPSQTSRASAPSLQSNASTPVPLKACLHCQKGRRKCDKEYPACGYCKRTRKTCDYAKSVATRSTSDELEYWKAKYQEVATESHSNERISTIGESYPSAHGNGARSSNGLDQSSMVKRAMMDGKPSTLMAMFFLDNFMWRETRSWIAKTVQIPNIFDWDLRSSNLQHSQAVDSYVRTVDQWLPILSRNKIDTLRVVVGSLNEFERLLLLSSIRLVTSTPFSAEAAGSSDLYISVRKALMAGSAAPFPSIVPLQAMILLTVYEMGHGLYPAAFLSLGSCISMGQALGLHNSESAIQMIPRPRTLVMQEEFRRAWWAVLLLDRFINLGCLGRPLNSRESTRHDNLPSNDESWEQGLTDPSEPLFVTSDTDVEAGSFARTCQAMHLLGRWIAHRDDENMPASSSSEGALQLHATTSALATLLEQEWESGKRRSMSTAICLSYSTLLAIFDLGLCTEKLPVERSVNDTVYQRVSMAGLVSTADTVSRFVAELQMSEALEQTSPFILEAVYETAAAYLWLWHEQHEVDAKAAYQQTRETLLYFSGRWKVAGMSLLRAFSLLLTKRRAVSQHLGRDRIEALWPRMTNSHY